MQEVGDERKVAEIMSLATTVFLLPFLLFSMHAGSLADHFSKRPVLMVSKAAETGVMLFCMMGLLVTEDFSFILVYLLVGLFLMGTQSTYYSPAKFGILPEILPEKLLSWGNGIFEMSGMIAIILGSVMGAECVGLFAGRLYLAPVLFAGVAALGLLATWFVPPVPAAAPSEPIKINPLEPVVEHASRLFRNRILFVTLLSVVFIWSLGVLFQLTIALYAKETLLLPERHAALPMGVIAVGVGIGTVLAGFLSGKTIEVGLVPMASLGIAFSSLVLYFTGHSIALTFGAVAFLGICAGLFIVPTHALLQKDSPTDKNGGIWAATNLLQTIGMLFAAQTFVFLRGVLRLSPPEIFLTCAGGIFVLACLLAAFMPETVGRMLGWLKITAGPRVNLEGQDHIPPQGPILFIVRGASPRNFHVLLAGTRRFVRFVLPHEELTGFCARLIARTLRAIPIEGGPGSTTSTEILKALEKGEAVAVFTPDGREDTDPAEIVANDFGLNPEDIPAPVVPVTFEENREEYRLEFKAPEEFERALNIQ